MAVNEDKSRAPFCDLTLEVVACGIASVGNSDADPRAAPQTPQKWFRSGFSEEHERHRAIEAHSVTGEMPVVALERCLDEGLG